MDERIGRVSGWYDLGISGPIDLAGQQLQDIPDILKFLDIHPDKVVDLHRFLVLLLLGHRLELGLCVLLHHVAAEPIQELDEVLVRGYHELDVHHCFFVDLDDLEAVLGQLSHVDQLVQLIEVL